MKTRRPGKVLEDSPDNAGEWCVKNPSMHLWIPRFSYHFRTETTFVYISRICVSGDVSRSRLVNLIILGLSVARY